MAALRCALHETFDGGDHTIVVGRVTELLPGPPDARPLIFYAGRYRHLREPDPEAHPAPDLWIDHTVQLYYHEWDHPPDPEESPFG